MAVDIVPELYEAIRADFEKDLAKDPKIKGFAMKLKKGTAQMQDVSEYAGDLGECAQKVLSAHLTAESLPDGRLYWNIAERTVKPILEIIYSLVGDAAEKIQKDQDQKQKIGIKPIKAPFPKDRVDAFLNAITLPPEEVEEN